MKRPSFQFYPKDLLSDTEAMAMPNEALGMYFKLLCYDWVNDGIPDDKKAIMRIVGFDWVDFQGNTREPEDYDIILNHLNGKLMAHPYRKGFLTNSRLQKEREKQDNFIKSKSQNGKMGAEKRWGKTNNKSMAKNSTAINSPMAKNSSSSSSSFIKKEIYKEKRNFKKPTKTEIQKYCNERKNRINADYFFDYYESKGWKVGNTPMKDWKAAMRTWEQNNKETIKTEIHREERQKGKICPNCHSFPCFC